MQAREQAEIEVLLNLCRVILADGVVTEKEAIYLASWIARNPQLSAVWPADAILRKLSRILEDKVLTPQELEELKATLIQFQP